MSVEFQAIAVGRRPIRAALTGAGIGLSLGAIFLVAGLNRAISDHATAARIARQARGDLSEAMLQREITRLDTRILRLVRDGGVNPDGASETGPVQVWPGRLDSRAPVGHRASALDGAHDLDCMTEAVYFEARGETLRGQAAIAQVVMNRIANPRFPKTVCGVVFQGASGRGCQFSFACDGSMRQGLDPTAWDRARRIAERALLGAGAAGVGGATHFHTIDVTPNWGPRMLRVAQVGLHIFYRADTRAVSDGPPAERVVWTGLTSATSGPTPALVLEKGVDAQSAGPTKGDVALAHAGGRSVDPVTTAESAAS